MATSLRQRAAEYGRAKVAYHKALAELRADITTAIHASQISEAEAARITGISRNTIRVWLGKQPQR